MYTHGEWKLLGESAVLSTKPPTIRDLVGQLPLGGLSPACSCTDPGIERHYNIFYVPLPFNLALAYPGMHFGRGIHVTTGSLTHACCGVHVALRTMDYNGDGYLSRDELHEGFRQEYYYLAPLPCFPQQ